MARYKHINWTDPIWETQEKEPPREAHYKDLFIKYNGTLTDFSNRYLPSLWKKHVDNPRELRVYFDSYDIKKGKPPSDRTVGEWSQFFYWMERRRAFKNSITEETRQSLRDTQISLLKDYIFNLKKVVPESLDAQLKNIEVLNSILLQDETEINGHMIKSHTEANINLEDYLRKALGLDETASSAEDLNESEADDIIPVPDNPEHENPKIHEEINNILWDMVNQK